MRKIWIDAIWRHEDNYKNVGTSKYWYVCEVGNGWQVRIKERGGYGRTLYREVFGIEVDAARASDRFLVGRFGLEVIKREGWRLNFPEGGDFVDEGEGLQGGLFG